jgi:hypothetical protein
LVTIIGQVLRTCGWHPLCSGCRRRGGGRAHLLLPGLGVLERWKTLSPRCSQELFQGLPGSQALKLLIGSKSFPLTPGGDVPGAPSPVLWALSTCSLGACCVGPDSALLKCLALCDAMENFSLLLVAERPVCQVNGHSLQVPGERSQFASACSGQSGSSEGKPSQHSMTVLLDKAAYSE